jgi:hypothetical protein
MKAERAAEVMREALRDGGWHLAGPIRRRLAAMGLDSGSVRSRAMRLAGVQTRKRRGGMGGPWEWRVEALFAEAPRNDGRVRAPSAYDPMGDFA